MAAENVAGSVKIASMSRYRATTHMSSSVKWNAGEPTRALAICG